MIIIINCSSHGEDLYCEIAGDFQNFLDNKSQMWYRVITPTDLIGLLVDHFLCIWTEGPVAIFIMTMKVIMNHTN